MLSAALLAAEVAAGTQRLDPPIWVWAAVVAAIVGMLVTDLLLLHRDAHTVTVKEAAVSSVVWIAIGCTFGLGVLVVGGGEAGGQWFSGYLIEQSLSVDNIFIFALLFGFFSVPAAYQHRALFWGVFGALVMRAVFIALGSQLLVRFDWMFFVFGAFLVFTALRMLRSGDSADVDPDKNPVLRLVRRVVPMTEEYEGQHFFVRQDVGGTLTRMATPLLAVVIAMETTDLVFAVDSIPAVFSVTSDPFLVYTSNAFAILGLRSLYFLLAGVMDRFAYLSVGLAVILAFVGVKMLLHRVWDPGTILPLVVIALVLAVAVGASLVKTRGAVPVVSE